MSYNLLEVDALRAGYLPGFDVLRDVSLRVDEHEVVTILGPNGAGKSTLLKTIAGLLRPRAGHVRLQGEEIGGLAPHLLVPRGVVTVPSGRQVFTDQSVEENLLMGAYHYRKDRSRVSRSIGQALDRFPELSALKKRPAGNLSGGQQQLLSMARGLMARPKLMLLDEPTLGLSPIAARSIFDLVVELKQEGVTILMVEKLVKPAAKVSDRMIVMELGAVALEGSAASVREDPAVLNAYLGKGEPGVNPG